MSSRILFLSLLLLPGLAAAQAGRFILAVGDVVVARGTSETRAGIGTVVDSGDTIRVGVNSNAQIRLTDESIIGLRPGTVLRLDEYAYSGSVDGRERNIFSLLKGGFRTVTGIIGRLQSRERYQVRTATATVGIRGTHYTLVHCDNDCEAAPTASGGQTTPGGPSVPNGTYGGVSDGRIAVENATGERLFGANEFFYVANQNAAPQSLIAPPSFLYDRLAGQQRNQGQKGQETSETMAQSGLNAESRPSEVPAAPAPNAFVVTEQRTATGSSAVLSSFGPPTIVGLGAEDGDDELAFVAASQLTLSGTGSSQTLQAFVLDPTVTDSGFGHAGDPKRTVSGQVGAGGIVDVGAANSADGVDAHWGRWVDGSFAHADGSPGTVGPGGFHYMYGSMTPADTIAAKTGTFAYNSFVGGTVPTDNFGRSASFASFSGFNVDFTNRTATFLGGSLAFPTVGAVGASSMSLTSASGSLVISSGKGAFIDVVGANVSCSGGPCGGLSTGGAAFTGGFMGTKGNHMGVSLGANVGSLRVQGVQLWFCPSCP